MRPIQDNDQKNYQNWQNHEAGSVGKAKVVAKNISFGRNIVVTR